MPSPESKAPREVQVHRFDFVWNRWDGCPHEEKEFSAQHTSVCEALRAAGAKQFVFQLERGVESKRLHFQGCVNLSKKKRAKALAKELQEDLKGISVRVASTAGEKALRQYVMKKDETYVAGPWADRRIVTPPVNVVPFDKWDPSVKVTDVRDNPRPFQHELTQLCLQWPANDRTIIWIADPTGCSGKSKWGTFMKMTHDAKCLTFGKNNDLMNLVCTDIEAIQAYRKIYIIKLPRTKPADVALGDMFATIEQLKDGEFQTGKYKGSDQEGPNPHVVVLSNWFPSSEERKCLTPDRWRIYTIDSRDFSLRVSTDEHVCGESCAEHRGS